MLSRFSRSSFDDRSSMASYCCHKVFSAVLNRYDCLGLQKLLYVLSFCIFKVALALHHGSHLEKAKKSRGRKYKETSKLFDYEFIRIVQSASATTKMGNS